MPERMTSRWYVRNYVRICQNISEQGGDHSKKVQFPQQLTLWLFNIAMENGPFIDDFPIKTSIYKGISMAMLNNQMVTYLNILKRRPGLLSGMAWSLGGKIPPPRAANSAAWWPREPTHETNDVLERCVFFFGCCSSEKSKCLWHKSTMFTPSWEEP